MAKSQTESVTSDIQRTQEWVMQNMSKDNVSPNPEQMTNQLDQRRLNTLQAAANYAIQSKIIHNNNVMPGMYQRLI